MLFKKTGLCIDLLNPLRDCFQTVIHSLIFDGGCKDIVEVGAISQRIESLLNLITIKDNLLLHIFESIFAVLQVYLLYLVFSQQISILVTLLLYYLFEYALFFPDGS